MGRGADFSGASLASFISRAYRVRSFQISGPQWMNTTRFDIFAKLPGGASPDQVLEMLQTLLAERFRLVLHRESKEFPVYMLVVGKEGPKLAPCPAVFDKWNSIAWTRKGSLLSFRGNGPARYRPDGDRRLIYGAGELRSRTGMRFFALSGAMVWNSKLRNSHCRCC